MHDTYTFKKGIMIECKLKRSNINPSQINYTWYSCDNDKCDGKLTLINSSNTLRLKRQSSSKVYYLCKAEHGTGNDSKIISVVRDFRRTTGRCLVGDNKHSLTDLNNKLLC